MAGEAVFEQLAQLASDVSYDALPSEVVEATQRRVLDALGCMLAGWEQPTVQAVFRAVDEGSGAATIVGDKRRASVGGAALANCTSLRYLDYLDSHPGPVSCHPALIIPGVLATAESVDASGADVIRSIALGYEVDIRLQLSVANIGVKGWSGSTNLGIAVPIAVGSILGLPADRLAHAVAVATDHAPTLAASAHGHMAESKATVDGMVAMMATTATLMARSGVDGPVHGFGVEDGFGAVVAERWDEAVLLGPIDRLRIVDVNTKLYNTVKRARAAVSAAIKLRSENGLEAADIAEVRVYLAQPDVDRDEQSREVYRRPGNRHTANHSAVFSIAAALVDGELGPGQFESNRLTDPEMLAMVDRLELRPEPAFAEYWPAANPARVEVVTHDGRELSVLEHFAPGHARNPVSQEQLLDKFHTLAGRRVSRAQADAIVAAVAELPTLTSLAPLWDVLSV